MFDLLRGRAHEDGLVGAGAASDLVERRGRDQLAVDDRRERQRARAAGRTCRITGRPHGVHAAADRHLELEQLLVAEGGKTDRAWVGHRGVRRHGASPPRPRRATCATGGVPHRSSRSRPGTAAAHAGSRAASCRPCLRPTDHRSSLDSDHRRTRRCCPAPTRARRSCRGCRDWTERRRARRNPSTPSR